VTEDAITILPDMTRRTPVVDPDDHHLYTSLGCAAANLALAGAATGRAGETRFDPAGEGSLVFAFTAGTPARSDLADAIPRRLSTRMPFDGRTVSTADLAKLAAAAAVPGVEL
jgi:hypothetical protein